MKKCLLKQWFLVFLLLLTSCSDASTVQSTGRCLVTQDGCYLVILQGDPIMMHDLSEDGSLFDGLKTGDEIRIRHDGIAETYPGQTGVSACKKLRDGDLSDIPEGIIETLSGLGWKITDPSCDVREIFTGTVLEIVSENGDSLLTFAPDSGTSPEMTVRITQDTQLKTVEGLEVGDSVRLDCSTSDGQPRLALRLTEYRQICYEYSYANLSVVLPADWCYEIQHYSEESAAFGIDFWPEGVGSGRIRLEYYPDLFGVCGTGLTETAITVNGYSAIQGTYDGNDIWSYLLLEGLPGSYVIQQEGCCEWWSEYADTVMDILTTLQVANGYIDRDQAVITAAQTANVSTEPASVYFDFDQGYWNVQFTDGDSVIIATVSANGETCCVDSASAEVARKPVLYLYPQEETTVTVRLDLNGKLTSSYPSYHDGWTVTARPDGTLTDGTGQEYYCLFWEAQMDLEPDFSQGFCVPGDETAAFLEDTLEKLGLNRREANEFIIYWLPMMEGNAYNLISFQQEAYTDAAGLQIDPAPDSVLRICMAWKALEEPVSILAQSFPEFIREGFTAIEWGGIQYN